MFPCSAPYSECSVYAKQVGNPHHLYRAQPSCLFNVRDRRPSQRGVSQQKRLSGRNHVSPHGAALPRCGAPLHTSPATDSTWSQPTPRSRQRHVRRVVAALAAAATAGGAESSGSTAATEPESGRFAIVSGLQREPQLSTRNCLLSKCDALHALLLHF